MADVRTPAQINADLRSVREIADLPTRLKEMQRLRDEIADAKGAKLSAANDPNAPMNLNAAASGVKVGAEYDPILANIDEAEKQTNAAVEKAQGQAAAADLKATPAGQTPAKASIDQTTSDKDAAVLAEMKANQAAGKGFKTDAQVSADSIAQGHLQAAQDQVNTGNARLGLAQQTAALAAQQAQIRDDLANKRIDLTEALRQQQALNAQMLATARDQTNMTNLYSHIVTQQGQAVTQGDTRAQVAGSVFNNAVNEIGKGAAGMAPGQGQLATNALNALMNIAPQFQASMGGAPVSLDSPVTAAQKAKIASLVLHEGVPPDANGNRFGNAVQAVLNEGGFTGGPTGPIESRFEASGGLPRSATVGVTPAQAAAYADTTALNQPGQPGYTAPQFTAPAAQAA